MIIETIIKGNPETRPFECKMLVIKNNGKEYVISEQEGEDGITIFTMGEGELKIKTSNLFHSVGRKLIIKAV